MVEREMEPGFYTDLLKKTFGDQLIEVFEGDCLLGVPEQTFAYPHRFVVVLRRVGRAEVSSLRTLTAELPGCFGYSISESALQRYPRHGLVPLAFRRPLLGHRRIHAAELGEEALREGVRHGVLQIHHLIRRFLTEPQNPWRHLWANRLLDWLLETLDVGVLRPLRYLQTGEIDDMGPPKVDDPHLQRVLSARAERGVAWHELRAVYAADPMAARALLLDIQDWTEQCLPVVACDRPPLFAEDREVSAPGSAEGALTESFRRRLGEDLHYLSLFGSRARGEAGPDSDTDLIAVVERVGGELLDRIRALTAEFPGTTVYLLSRAGLDAYPRYRYYSLHRDARPLLGRLRPQPPLAADDVSEDIRHLLALLSRSSREYLIRGVYPLKVLGHLKWQAKKIDLICSRLWPVLSGEAPLGCRSASLGMMERLAEPSPPLFLELLRSPASVQTQARRDLAEGKRARIEQLLFASDSFAQRQLETFVPHLSTRTEPEPETPAGAPVSMEVRS